jgi:regulator of sigma E protease
MMVIYAIFVLGILIFVHEFGHFIVAKLFNVKVEKFSLGFGPKLLGRQIGETEYLLSAFPLGGYVKMFGEGGAIEGSATPSSQESDTEKAYDEESGEALDELPELTEAEKARSFAHKPPLARIAIVMAGPLFNLVFAWMIFILLCTLGVPTVTARIGEVLKEKPAARAGLLKDDIVTSINGHNVTQWDEIASMIAAGKGQPVTLTVKRNGQDLRFTITPEARVSKNLFGESVKGHAIGIAAAGEVVTETSGPLQAIVKGSVQTWKVIDLTIMSLVKMVQRVVPMDSVGGPIMIAKMAGETAQMGLSSFLAFMALLSINLGVLNLLPVPVLDGGHLFFFFCELIIGRPVNQKVREYAQQIGLFLLLSLMVLAFYNDIIRYFFSHQG